MIMRFKELLRVMYELASLSSPGEIGILTEEDF